MPERQYRETSEMQPVDITKEAMGATLEKVRQFLDEQAKEYPFPKDELEKEVGDKWRYLLVSPGQHGMGTVDLASHFAKIKEASLLVFPEFRHTDTERIAKACELLIDEEPPQTEFEFATAGMHKKNDRVEMEQLKQIAGISSDREHAPKRHVVVTNNELVFRMFLAKIYDERITKEQLAIIVNADNGARSMEVADGGIILSPWPGGFFDNRMQYLR